MENISVQEVKDRLDKGEEINLIDVREPYEHAEFNIGGILYPLGDIRAMMVEELEDLKDKEVVLYCRTGNRSAQAAMILDMLGFENTKNLVGGVVAWQEQFGG